MALDETRKARLMAHMNKEHTAELSQYLRAFNGLSSSAARDAKLTDLSLDTLQIRSRSGTHVVAITPPLDSLADARERLVDMARRAQTQPGLSGVTVDRWTAPATGGWVSLAGIVFYAASVALALSGGARPGSPAYDLADKYVPYGADNHFRLVRVLVPVVVAIHACEAFWMARSRLAKHGVEAGSPLWCLWTVNTFWEGFPTFQRFDALVEEKKTKAEKH
ncbi:hypothetical protein F4780DRAFT_372612 [Xylariomycetidae sp. FL0641]|nr:hypothetical protein F4780DRAFT_372612 [Xylariomycetidae sp. FL0641]